MSDGNLQQAGFYALSAFKVTSYDKKKSVDLKLVVYSFNLFESMSLGALQGSAVIYDSWDLIRNFPFVCEEFLDITYTDFFGVERTERMFVYGITDISYPSDEKQGIMQYTLNFVSIGRMFSETYNIRRAYRADSTNQGRISDYANSIFDAYYVKPLSVGGFTSKDIVIEPTTGSERLIVPCLNPESAMNFMARRAFSSTSKTQSYRFFESRERYWFATNEFMATIAVDPVGYFPGGIDPGLASALGIKEKTPPVFVMSYAGDVGPERQVQLMYELQAIDFGMISNTLDDINFGGYRRRLWEVDIVNGAITSQDFTYTGYGNTDFQLPVHAGEFLDTRMSKISESYVMKDYASPGATTGDALRSNPYYSPLYSVKPMSFYHYDRNRITTRIYGRNTLFAGDIITLQLYEHSAESAITEDDQRSGDYIVESIDNKFIESTYTQDLVLSRAGLVR